MGLRARGTYRAKVAPSSTATGQRECKCQCQRPVPVSMPVLAAPRGAATAEAAAAAAGAAAVGAGASTSAECVEVDDTPGVPLAYPILLAPWCPDALAHTPASQQCAAGPTAPGAAVPGVSQCVQCGVRGYAPGVPGALYRDGGGLGWGGRG